MLKKKKLKDENEGESATYYAPKSLRRKEGHHVVESGNKYKSKDGRSDALRKG